MNQDKYIFKPDIIIEVTNGCNMICKGCYAPNILVTDDKKNSKTVTNLTLNVLKHNWSQNEKVNCISIRGGEPSLNPELPQILLFLADKANNIFLETNGTWIQSNKDLLQAIEISKVKVKLSLDKMHQSSNFNFEIWLKILKDSNIDTAIAIN